MQAREAGPPTVPLPLLCEHPLLEAFRCSVGLPRALWLQDGLKSWCSASCWLR